MLTAWGPGQPSGAALLLLGVDARAVEASKMLDEMVRLADAASVALARGDDVSKCEELIQFVKTRVPHIKLAMTYASDLSTAQSQIVILESKVEALTKELASLRAELTSSKQRVLIGEVAFMLDKVASDFVVGEAGVTYTMGELRSMAQDNELSAEQLQKWEKISGFLRWRGWTLGKLCACSRVLKDTRKGDAHSTPAEKKGVTLEDLVKWVGEEPTLTAQAECQQFVQLVSKFGQVGSPLLPLAVAEVSVVVSAP